MLDIYIEKAFLDDFYLSYDEITASNAQKILYQILVNYPETRWFIDCRIDSIEDLEILKQENPFFAYKAVSYPPHPIDSIKDSIDADVLGKSILVLTKDRETWHKELEMKGALCLSSDNYELEIQKLIERYHYKIDLSDGYFEWKKLKVLSVFNRIVINDNYILTDKSNQKIDQNLAPLLKQLICDFKQQVQVEIFSKDFGALPPGNYDQVKQAVSERIKKLNRVFANYDIRFKIINNALPIPDFVFHDRVLLTNFQSIDCGVGFNLFADKNGGVKKSNSQIISETIFDLYTYKRIKNLRKMHQNYLNRISGQGYSSIQFTFI